MPLDLLRTSVSEPSVRITLEQTSHDAPSFIAHFLRESKRVMKDALIHQIDILVVEWWKTGHHLIQKDTKRPPIDGLGVSLTLEQFGSDVLGCTAECFVWRLAIR
jgi:hypothetical protein